MNECHQLQQQKVHVLIYGTASLEKQAIKHALEQDRDVICSITLNINKLVQSVPCSPCVLVLDCRDISVEQLTRVLQSCQSTRVSLTAMLINAASISDINNFLNFPAVKGCFLDYPAPHLLFKGLNDIIQGKTWFPRSILEHFLETNRKLDDKNNNRMVSVVCNKLTRRENEILNLVKTGASNTKIADELCLSHHTIKTHMNNLFKKLNVQNRVQAANWSE